MLHRTSKIERRSSKIAVKMRGVSISDVLWSVSGWISSLCYDIVKWIMYWYDQGCTWTQVVVPGVALLLLELGIKFMVCGSYQLSLSLFYDMCVDSNCCKSQWNSLPEFSDK